MLSHTRWAIAVLMLLTVGSFARTWTDSLGREFEATFIRSEGDKVFLNVKGHQRVFTMSQLSARDQQLVARGGVVPKKTTTTPPQTPTKQARSRGQIQANTTIKVERLRADAENKRWVYGSPNFEFICNQDLGLARIRDFAWMFESVWQFCETLPFDLPRLRAQQKVRMKTYLIKEYKDYVRLGGIPRSLGTYISSQDVVLIPFLSLDLEKSAKDGNGTLRHEVTHQLMVGQTQQAGWFIEGSAEYVATVPYENTRLLTDRHMKSIVAYLSAFGWNERSGHNLSKFITFGRLESFMVPNYGSFQKQKHAYANALVLFTYFARLDGEKKGKKLAQYVAALQDGRPEMEARKFLLAGRSYEQLEKDVVSAWSVYGLKLKFE